LVVGHKLVVELKAVESLLPVHEAQLLTYLKLSGLTLGLLINFNVPVLKSGIKRIVNNFQDSASPRLRGEFIIG
jgi:GxxExxY protein